MNLTKIFFGAAALLLMTSCGGGKMTNPFASDTKPVEHMTSVLSTQNVQLESTYPVTIKGQDDIEIRPRIDGFIEKIYVDEGSVVKKGQALFKINSPKAEQDYTTALAAISGSEAKVKTAELNVNRIRPLAEKGIVSNVQLATLQNAYETELANLARDKATLKNAEASRSWTTVTSPVDGVVGSIPFRMGSLVNSANALTTVSSIGNVFAYFSMNEKEFVSLLGSLEGTTQAEKIKNIPEVTLRMADGTAYSEKGKIKTIGGQVNVTTGSVNLRADFSNKDGLLRSGFSGTISIPKYMENAIVIPQEATKTQQNKFFAYKVQGDTMAVQTIITVIPTPDGKSYVVTDGLKAGDQIVTEGMVTMADGKKIIAKK